jgi:hypothetical protein
MSKSIAMIRLAYRDRSTQVGNSVQLSAGYSFPDLKQSSGGRNSLHIRLLIDAMAIRARSSLWRGSQQPNAVRRGNADTHMVAEHTITATVPDGPVGTVNVFRTRQTSPEKATAELATGHRR